MHERAELEALFETMRSQIVHTHGYRPDVLALPVARRMGIGTASTLHGFTGVGIRVRLYERLQVRYAAKADAAIAVSTGVAARLRRAGALADNVHLVRNAYCATECRCRGTVRGKSWACKPAVATSPGSGGSAARRHLT